jgi:hypothetical protein
MAIILNFADVPGTVSSYDFKLCEKESITNGKMMINKIVFNARKISWARQVRKIAVYCNRKFCETELTRVLCWWLKATVQVPEAGPWNYFFTGLGVRCCV